MVASDHYDVIVIGSGPGGASAGHRLAAAGKTRVAVFEGAIESGGEDAFFAQVRERLEPIWRRFPNVKGVRVLRTARSDPGAIPIVMVLEMDFADLDAIHASLDSAIKTEAHETTLEVLKPFSGRFFHFIAESRSLGPG